MARGRRSGQESPWVEVELFDDADTPSTADGGRDSASAGTAGLADDAVMGFGEPGGPASARRARRPLLPVAVAVGVLLVIGAYAVDARMTAAHRAELSALPGVLGTVLDAPLGEVWRLPGQWDATDVDGTLVLSGWEDGALRGVDPADGRVVWERPPTSGPDRVFCTVLEAASRTGAPASPGVPLRPLALCLETEAGEGDAPTETRGRLVAVDAATGLDAQSITVDGALTFVDVQGEDLLLAWVGPHLRLQVVRWSPWDGGDVWRFDSSADLNPGSELRFGWSVSRTSDGLLVEGATRLLLDLGTGASREAGGPAWARRVVGSAAWPLPDGGSVEWETSYTGVTEGRVLDGTGATRFEVQGTPLVTGIDDGTSRSPLLVASSSGQDLSALDPATGRALWEREDAGASRLLLRLGGVALVSDGISATALSERDGGLRWEADLDGGVTLGPVTDGEVVLLPVDSRPRSALVARRLSDGAVVWTADLPAGARSLDAAAGVVLVRTDEALVALR